MRIAFIANGLSYGGAEKMLAFVASELQRRGHNVAILNTAAHSGTSQRIAEGLKIYSATINTKNRKLAYLKRLLFCIKSAKDFKAEVVVGFLAFPNLYSVITGKLLRIPSVISERADPYLDNANNGRFENLLLKIVCSASGAVFQTDGAAEFYPEKLRKRSSVIPNPISITREYRDIPYGEREDSIVSLGRIDNHQKRMDVMLKAFQIFHQTHPSYELHIYGGGPDLGLVEQLAKEFHVETSVKLMGVSKNSMEDMCKSKIFAISSDYEGISNSLLEAMACGMPVVSTDHSPGGARFLINDGENGLLSPIGDAEGVAQNLTRFADNSHLAQKCGENARKVLEKFSPNIIINKWEEYLSFLLNK